MFFGPFSYCFGMGSTPPALKGWQRKILFMTNKRAFVGG
jgi:hypothetical protein